MYAATLLKSIDTATTFHANHRSREDQEAVVDPDDLRSAPVMRPAVVGFSCLGSTGA